MTEFSRVSLEEVQAYWDRRPCNLRHSPRTPGTREYFDEVESRKYFVEPHIPPFADFGRWSGKKVLEIGCGIGTDTVSFARAGAHVTAVDLSPNSVALARQRVRAYGLEERVRFHCGDAESLDRFLPAEEYDLVYAFGVIHHTPRPRKAVEALRSYLKPGGTFKLMVYHRRSWKVLWILLTYGKGRFWRSRELIARHSEAETGCPVTYAYVPGELADLLKGFRIRSVRIEHIFPYRVEDYVRYRYRKAWFFRWMPRALFSFLEKRLGWHLCVTAEKEDAC